ncbi:hypothetical protein ACLOJK_036698 [Asimina triloba]
MTHTGTRPPPPRKVCELNGVIARHISTEEIEKLCAEQDFLLIESVCHAAPSAPTSDRRPTPFRCIIVTEVLSPSLATLLNGTRTAPVIVVEIEALNDAMTRALIAEETTRKTVSLFPTTPISKRNTKLYCYFHEEADYVTEECRQRRDAIEEKVRNGRLAKCITTWARGETLAPSRTPT